MKSTMKINALRVTAFAAALLTAGVSSAADVYLRAESFVKNIPNNDGMSGMIPVQMWGFADCHNDTTFTTCDQAISPGPQINLDVSEGALTIHVKNMLADPVSVIIPGLGGAGDPVPMTDMLGRSRVRSLTHETAPGGTADYIIPLEAGTYLYHSGTAPSLQVPMGLYGALVVRNGTAAYPGVTPDSEALVLIGELDPIQNARLAVAATLGDPTPQCVSLTDYVAGGKLDTGYPCSVDYYPVITLVNGETTVNLAPGIAPGDLVLLRMLNAGQRTHVPTIPNFEMSLIAEDGNLYPGNPRVQSEALLPAGKTLDALIQTAPGTDVTLAVSDRMPSYNNEALTNGDGALAGVVIGTGTPAPGESTVFAVNDTYPVPEDAAPYNSAFSVLNNDVGLAGSALSVSTDVSHGALTLNGDGSFTYTPDADFSGTDTFSYVATLAGESYPANVMLNVSFVNDAPLANADGPYTNTVGTTVSVDAAHGVLGNDTDPDGDTLTAVLEGGTITGLTLHDDGSFEYTGAGTMFDYHATDGASNSNSITVMINHNPPSKIALNVTDPDGVPVTSYRWILQEDTTYLVDPDNPGNPADMLSVKFHKSYMPVVAQGCVGQECPTDNTVIPVAPFTQAVLDGTRHYYVSVLPNDAGTGTGHSLGGAPIPVGTTSADTINVIVNKQPIPTAQLTVLVFEDNAPTNGAPDGTEPGLGGFEITLEDAAGRYGQSPGTVNFDVNGEPLRNALDCPGDISPPEGVILTCPDGRALIQNLPPGKYGVIVTPPAGPDVWTQTATIEGTNVIDAWIGANEPPYLVEFGGAAPHAFIGFVNPANTVVPESVPPGLRNNTVTGYVDLLHTARPPIASLIDSGSYNGFSHTRPWIGLNSSSGGGPNFATVQADLVEDGSGNLQAQFTIEGIPDGSYQLAIWDDYLDQIISYQAVDLSGGTITDVGRIPVPSWFGRQEHTVYLDNNANGIRDEGEPGLPDQNINLRFRDGTIFQSFPTDLSGFVPFDQIFPFLNWMVAEVDYARFKPTGVRYWVDGGGDVTGGDFPGLLNPQVGSPHTDITPVPVLLEGFQSIMGNTSVFEWGKVPYEPGENGGIAGIVFYGSTRGENDPRLTVGDTWEPGIPRITVRLYKEIAAIDKDNTPTGNFPGVEDVDINGNGLLDTEPGTSLTLVDEVQTDSWDDNLPTDCPGEAAASPFASETLAGDVTRCYDGYRNYEQVRPAVFDGGYFFGDLDPGAYVVEVVPSAGYEIIKEEDKNVDFGDAFEMAPVPMMVAAAIVVLPDAAMVAEAQNKQWGLLAPPCVGPLHTVPDTLSLFPGQVVTYAPFAGADRPLCNMKRVILSDQANAAADFHLFTSTPVAGQFTGLSTDDILIETDQRSVLYGDKHGPPFMPIRQYDWSGHEIWRGYTDAFGKYNGMVPSTFSANVPIPSGYSPAIHSVCLNDRTDPHALIQYGTVCYELMYMPGTTTYLDTPILPQSGFAAGFNPVDCAMPDGYPEVASVDSPLVPPGGTLTLHSVGVKSVPNPDYEGPSATQPAMIDRNYGFGAPGYVFLDDTPLENVLWTDATITGTVPAGLAPGDYELSVISHDGKQTINTVTITVGTETATLVSTANGPTAIQDAIDAASAGDLIIVAPGTYYEQVVMWKPVRLQGSGAYTIINAIAVPVTKVDAWQTKVASLVDTGKVDLLPTQAAGADPFGPALFGTETGAGITVLAKSDDSLGTSFTNHASRIDGFTITSGDSGGGIYVNGYAHNLVISNNNVTGNSGTLHGGLRIGAPELGLDTTGPFAFNTNVNIHHNSITHNGAQTDTAVGGGVTLCTGTDDYSVNHNFICGNFNLGNGAGISHYGLSDNGEIAFNQILFNQTFNQGVGANGGGVFIGGEPAVVTTLTLGSGNVIVDGNLIKGNEAGSGHGAGIRTQNVNGNDVSASANVNNWWSIKMRNNTIVNNVTGWSGGGISMLDTVNAEIALNTIANNDSTGTAGAIIGAGPQPAGISSESNSAGLDAVIPGTAVSRLNFSNPQPFTHNIIWHNRSFTYDDSTATPQLLPALAPTAAGECASGANYIDLGVLDPTYSLVPQFSILTNASGTNTSADPQFLNEYCNTSRTLSGNAIEVVGPIVVAVEPVEGGNFASVRFGPLTQEWPVGAGLWDYHITGASPAINKPQPLPAGLNIDHDIDNQIRPNGMTVDLGSDEYYAGNGTGPQGSAAFTSASPYSITGSGVGALLNFGIIANTTVSSTVTVTASTAPVTISSMTVAGNAAFSKGTDNCTGSTLAANGTCTVVVSFNGGNNNSPKSGALTMVYVGAGSPKTLNLRGN
jgi:FtsP/CotA-like multicopper oxidase with cupredoxin domain